MVRKRKSLTLAIALGIGVSFVFQNINTNGIEAWFYDTMVKIQREKPIDPRIVIVRFDKETDDKLGKPNWPVSFQTQLDLATKLAEAQPKGVAFVVPIEDQHLEHDPMGKTWLDLVSKQKNFIFVQGFDHDADSEAPAAKWMTNVPHYRRSTTWDRVSFSQDNVFRRAMIFEENRPSLMTALAQFATDQPLTPQTLKNLYRRDDFNVHYTYINFAGSTKEPQKLFPEYSAIDVISGKVPAHVFKDKVILVGRFNLRWRVDNAFTPYGRGNSENASITVNAHILNNILQNNGVAAAPSSLSLYLSIFLAIVISICTMVFSPTLGLISTLSILFGMFVLAAVALGFGNYWLPIAKPLLTAFSSYYILIPYRFVQEYKKRFFYQQAHDQLAEVEELKRNFISMMSHNLKTPIARITGMADIIGRSGPLTEEQIKGIQEIHTSTEELTRFVSSILGLAKVESTDTKINLVSKDVNKIIESVVSKFRFLAQQKNLQIKLDLEPLFSIKVDAELITQALHNLIDNALKYSPPNTQITIQSREVDGFIEIQVIDQGFGIKSEDRDHIFAKFYRSTSDDIRSIQGTGLGLYLVKYFVELHQGRVDFDSTPGLGTKFRLVLPV